MISRIIHYAKYPYKGGKHTRLKNFFLLALYLLGTLAILILTGIFKKFAKGLYLLVFTRVKDFRNILILIRAILPESHVTFHVFLEAPVNAPRAAQNFEVPSEHCPWHNNSPKLRWYPLILLLFPRQ